MDAVGLPGRRGRPRCRPVKLAGEKGYSDPRIRRWLARHGIKAVIPRRADQRPGDKRSHFDADAYKRRSVVERCLGWLKECRAMATRFDKLAVNYLATVKLAMIRRYLRKLAPVHNPSVKSLTEKARRMSRGWPPSGLCRSSIDWSDVFVGISLARADQGGYNLSFHPYLWA